MEIKFCPECGEAWIEGSSFCANCGHPVVNSETIPNQQNYANRNLLINQQNYVNQNQFPNQPYAANQQPRGVGIGVISLVLGIISILFWCIPGIGIVCSIAGVIIGTVAIKINNGKNLGSAGRALGIMTLALYIFIMIDEAL